MYTALYRQERPETFKEVIGQNHIVQVLSHQVRTDTVGHAYLFCGTRGTGKTTIARLLAKAVNCQDEDKAIRPCGHCDNCEAIRQGSFVDVIELDGASNRGVDNVRELKESVNYPPAVGRKKVYIIDEVHMLTTPAFNALLKTLEEPPENVILILATTDPQQLPQTILSRCQRLDFKRVTHGDLVKHFMRICENQGVVLSPQAADILATSADGSVRDGLSLLEQCLASGEQNITEEVVLEYAGGLSQEFLLGITECVIRGDLAEGISLINQAVDKGKESRQILKDLTGHYRNLMVSKLVENPQGILNLAEETVELIKKQSSKMELSQINKGLLLLANTAKDSKSSTQPRIFLELAFMKLAAPMEFSAIQQDLNAESKFGSSRAIPRRVFSENKTKSNTSKTLENQKSATPNAEAHRKLDMDFSEGSILSHDEKVVKNVKITEITVEDQSSYGEIWNEICRKVSESRPSVGSLRSKARIIDISETQFTIEAENKVTKQRLEGALALISEVATVVLKRPVRGKVISATKDSEDGVQENDETLQRLQELLGDVEIKTI